jgi:DNA modification methylase
MSYPDNSVDCLMTDPPYSTDIDNINEFVKLWLPLALQKVRPDGRCYICTGAYPSEIQAYLSVFLAQTKFIVDNPLIWTYRNTLGITPKNKYNLNFQMIWHLYGENSPELDTSITNEMFSVQDINAPDGRVGNRFHTWQKPDELANRLIRHGTQEYDLVIDPFVCTGTFLLAAARHSRIARGCDINKENLKIAIERGCKYAN